MPIARPTRNELSKVGQCTSSGIHHTGNMHISMRNEPNPAQRHKARPVTAMAMSPSRDAGEARLMFLRHLASFVVRDVIRCRTA